MTTTVSINSHGTTNQVAALTNDHPAAKAVRMKFNPSGLSSVDLLKTIMAAYIAMLDEQAMAFRNRTDLDADQKAEAGRAFALAKTNAQQASMWGVFGVTTGL